MNKFYTGAEHIGEAFAHGINESYTCTTVEEAIDQAKETLEMHPDRDAVIVVQIIRIVRRGKMPITVERV